MDAIRDFSPDFRGTTPGPGTIEEYGRFQQHLVLLEDAGRMAAYVAAIAAREPGDVVVDVGAGTGVLGMLALAHGYRRAILIEPSQKMSAYARHLARLNGFEERITVVSSTLEEVDMARVPGSIDLVVSETLSSLIFGFGSWDALPRLAERLRDRRNMLPFRGRLLVSPTREPLATRGPDSDGLALLRKAGLTLDLFERTFRSAGNVYDKALIERLRARGDLQAVELASFDFGRDQVFSLETARIVSPDAGCCGILAYWEVELVPGVAPIRMTNLDPRVTSWYPYYIPFRRRVEGEFDLRLELLARDRPYKYAFQLTTNGEALTHVLYW